MNGSFLLDTNIVIAVFAKERTAAKKLAQAEDVYLPSVEWAK